MSGTVEGMTPDGNPTGQAARSGQDTSTLLSVAMCLVIAAMTWYLLKEFAMLLRPLLLAVFGRYVIVPIHLRLKESFPGPASIVVMVGGSVAILFVLALMIQSSIVALTDVSRAMMAPMVTRAVPPIDRYPAAASAIGAVETRNRSGGSVPRPTTDIRK